jgi:hypothetical protein
MKTQKLEALELAIKLSTQGNQKDADVIVRLLSSVTELEDQVALLNKSSDS